MRKKPKRRIRVQFNFAHGVLTVTPSNRINESLLALPFYAVALCVLDPDRGESGCIAISSTVKMVHEVHIFQGLSHEQVRGPLAYRDVTRLHPVVTTLVFARLKMSFWDLALLSARRGGDRLKLFL